MLISIVGALIGTPALAALTAAGLHTYRGVRRGREQPEWNELRRRYSRLDRELDRIWYRR